MTRRVPVVATTIVLCAVAIMVALGVWQLQRAQWKAEMLERYRSALSMSSDVPWPQTPADIERSLYRHTAVICERVIDHDARSGRNAAGEAGWAHVARCDLAGVGEADILIGWSKNANPVPWTGGQVSGFIGPGRADEARLIASPPLAGLEANAPPNPEDIPNDHIAYAFQWFFFALTALGVYALALRRRNREA